LKAATPIWNARMIWCPAAEASAMSTSSKMMYAPKTSASETPASAREIEPRQSSASKASSGRLGASPTAKRGRVCLGARKSTSAAARVAVSPAIATPNIVGQCPVMNPAGRPPAR